MPAVVTWSTGSMRLQLAISLANLLLHGCKHVGSSKNASIRYTSASSTLLNDRPGSSHLVSSG